jgi:hypothetical protein
MLHGTELIEIKEVWKCVHGITILVHLEELELYE